MNLPVPGWYRDPYWPAGLRWWDGAQWTHHARLPERPAPPLPPLPPHAGRNEHIGRLAMLTWAPLNVVYLALLGWTLAKLFRGFSAPADVPAGAVPAPLSGWSAQMALTSAVGMLVWVPLVLMIIWAYRCSTTAAALRIPAVREPVWAAVAWVIPVINLWFPYQSVRDCLPPEHPARRDVLRWWLGYLAVSLGGATLWLMALIGTAPFVTALVVVAIVAVFTTYQGLRVAKAIDDAHRTMLAH